MKHFTIENYNITVYTTDYYEVRLLDEDLEIDWDDVGDDFYLPAWNYAIVHIDNGTIEGTYQQLGQALSVCEQLNFVIKYERYKLSEPTPPEPPKDKKNVLKFPH